MSASRRIRKRRLATGIAALAALGIATYAWQYGSDDGPEIPGTDVSSKIAPVPEPIAQPTPPVPETIPDEQKPPPAETREITVRRGDTMMKLLTGNTIPRKEAHAIVTALRPVYNLQRMKVGQRFTVALRPDTDAAGSPRLVRLTLQPDPDRGIVLRHVPEQGFHAEIVERQLERRDSFAKGQIASSLYNAAVAIDLPIDVLTALIKIFSFDVDFQREIQSGDKFAVLFERFHDEFGEPARNGRIVWASMTLSNNNLEYFQFTPESGFSDHYDRHGKSVRKTLMRTPINGARLSSGYGKRRDPILGYTKMHRGVDFEAPRGVPILAAGDGVIEKIGRNGSYGKYIRIRHNSTYKTAYAHMSGYFKGLKRGSRVRQGSTIGYVGSTGRSTGPHLHYEVIVNDRQTDPMSIRLPAGKTLKGKDLETFQAHWPAVLERIALARDDRKLASD